MRKKQQLFGYVLFFLGTMLFGIMHLAIALYIPNLTGWSDPPGKLVTVLNEMLGWVPYIISIIFMAIGVCILIFDLWQTSIKKKD